MTPSSRRHRRHKYYVLYVEIGLILALLVLITAARIHVTPREAAFQVHLQDQEVVQMEEITQTEQQKTAPAPPRAPVPVEVPDNVVIEQEQVIDFDASLDLSASLDTTMGPPAVADERETSPVNPEDEIFVVVEQQPELIGGMAALQRAVNYPTFAQKTGLQGRVFVEFVVDETGTVQSPRIVRGVHKLLDTEALRVVQEMRFRPGRQRDVPVKVRMTLPVYFRLLDARAAN